MKQAAKPGGLQLEHAVRIGCLQQAEGRRIVPWNLGEVDGILTLGGRQSARELDRYDYLRAETDLLREAVDARVPVFGACLGGQMLALALGGEVRRMPSRIIDWRESELLPAAADDPE